MSLIGKTNLKGPLYLFGAFTLAGTSVIAARFVSSYLGVFTTTVVSLFFAVLCLLPLCRGSLIKIIKQMKVKDWLMLLLQALFGIFLFRMFLLKGLSHTSSGEAGILTGATPAATALLARFALKEQVNRKSLFGILSTLCGILLIQGVLMTAMELRAEHLWGNVLVLCAALSEALFNILSRINNLKAAGQDEPLNPVIQTALVSAIALILCIIPSLFEEPVTSLMSLGTKEWLSLAWYGIFVTALAFIFWYAGIKRCTAHTAAAFSGMMPFTSLTLSVIILGEAAGWQQWSGGILIIIGMLLIGGHEGSSASHLKLDVTDSLQ